MILITFAIHLGFSERVFPDSGLAPVWWTVEGLGSGYLV
jgi:hypothetical protein